MNFYYHLKSNEGQLINNLNLNNLNYYYYLLIDNNIGSDYLRIKGLCYSNKNDIYAVFTERNDIYIIDINHNLYLLIFFIRYKLFKRGNNNILYMHFSNYVNFELYVALDNNTIEIYNIHNNKDIKIINLNDNCIYIDSNPTEPYIICTTLSNVMIYNTDNCKNEVNFDENDAIQSIYSCKGKYFIIGKNSMTFSCYYAENYQLICDLQLPDEEESECELKYNYSII